MKNLFRNLIISASIVFPTVLFLAPISAQTASTTDPAVLAAQNQQAIADAQLKVLQDQQSSLTGLLPASSATPNSGAYTVAGSAPFPSQKIAYEQLKTIAKDLVRACSTPENDLDNKDICDVFTNVQGVMMYDSGEINNLLNYNALVATLKLLDGQAADLQTAYSPLHQAVQKLETLQAGAVGHKDFAPMLLPGLVLGSLKTVTDIIGMFRTNTSAAYNSYTADDSALIAVVSRELLVSGNGPVYLPSQMPLSLQIDYTSSAFVMLLTKVQKRLSNLQTAIGTDQSNLQQLSDALGAYVAADQAAMANSDQINAETDAAKKAVLKTKQVGLDRSTIAAKGYVLALYQSADTRAIDFATANVNKAVIDHLLKNIAVVYVVVSAASTSLGAVQNLLIAVSATGTSSLTAILRAEALLGKVNDPHTRILSIKTSVLGGAVVTRQNAFTGGHLFYTGGAIANFVVFDATGQLLHSGVLVSDDKGKDVKY
ncbi:MAG TPA: hypothetical protein VK814_07600 [Acidobacteriaceae bacterium]|jgi:hypothetical protein|nr:hypothetical protein [Acidobacteriaceae bacterium]